MVQRLWSRRAELAAGLVLALAILFNLAVLLPEVTLSTPALNDLVLHVPLVSRVADALGRGEDPTDPWIATFVEGYPLLHHYQHLPHLVTALLLQALGGQVEAGRLVAWITYLLLSAFPLSIYWAGRRLGVRALPASLAGAMASLVATDGLYGLDWASFVWRGYGLYTQLWGMWFLAPALAELYRTLREGRGYARTAGLMAATLLSHTLLGYVAVLSGALFLLVGGEGSFWRRAVRLVSVYLLLFAATAYFVVPFVRDHQYMNRSLWEAAGKYDAYGWEWTLKALVRGELLDYGRFPSLTLLAALGLGVCIGRWRRSETGRILVLFFGFWLLLYFGRPTWGALLSLLPLGGDLQLHRLILPVQLGAVGLAAAGVSWLVKQAVRWVPSPRPADEARGGEPSSPRSATGGRGRAPVAAFVAAAVAVAALLAPAYAERVRYEATGAAWRRADAAAFSAEGAQIDALLTDLQALPAARAYAGRAGSWGNEYRVGSVPMYALLAADGIANPGLLYHALSLNADLEGYLDEARPSTLNLFNLRYLVAPEGQEAPAFSRLLGSYGRHRLYEVDTTGYFDLVDSSMTLYGEPQQWFAAARAWLLSGLVEAKDHPRIVFGPVPQGEGTELALSAAGEQMASLAQPAGGACGALIGEEVQGNFYYAEFRADRACWLLLKATYHPGWQATVDGEPAELHMLAPSFAAVHVEAGHHQAVFRYTAPGWRLWGLLGGLLVLAVAAAAGWCTRRLGPGSRIRALGERIRAKAKGLAARWTSFRAPTSRLASRVQPAVRRLVSLAHSPAWVAVLFALLAGLPTLQLKQMTGHDALEYLPRTAEFYESLSEGHLIPRWAPDLSSGYGQPFFVFNPPAFYYLASLVHALGASLVASINLACLLLLLAASVGMYLYGRDLFGRNGGVVAGVAYVMAPWMLTTLYVRQALADFAAMAFVPWALWGLLRWISSGRARHLAVAAGAMALVLLSSNPVALIAIPALALYAAFLACRARSRRAATRAAAALGLGLSLPAYFWLPAVLERSQVHLERLLSGYLSYTNHFVYLHQLVYSPLGYGLSLPGPDDGMSFGLGAVQLALVVASLLVALRLRDRLRGAGEGWAHLWFFVLLLGLAAFLVTDNSIWLWNALPLLQYLEFPWRALVLAAMATAVLSAFPLLAVGEGNRRRWLLIAILVGLFLSGMARARPEGYLEVSDAQYSPEAIASQGIEVTTASEYEPVTVRTRPAVLPPADRLFTLGAQVELLKSEVSGTRIRWLVEAAAPVELEVAVFYYPGWRLTVDGEPQPLTVQNEYGVMDLTLTEGVHEVVVSFGSTPLRSWALALSAVAVAVLAGVSLVVAFSRRRSAAP